MEPLPRFFPLERLVAFSDGVFAVVITILVLGIEVPSDGALDPTVMALAREKFLHQLLVYVVAFGLIAMYWTQHSFLFAGLRRVDRGLVGRQWKHVLALPETHKGPRTSRLARRLVWGSRFFALVLFSGVLISLLDVKAGMAVILVMPLVFFANFIRTGKRPPSDGASADDADPEAPP